MNLRLSETDADNGTYEAEFVCQRRRDETGILQLKKTAGTLVGGIYGRASEDAAWVLISGRKHDDQSVVSTMSESGYLSEIPIFPLMKATVVTSGGAGANTFKVWFIE